MIVKPAKYDAEGNLLTPAVVKDQRKALARYIMRLPKEAREEGLFGNDIFWDVRRAAHSAADSIASDQMAPWRFSPCSA